jgi:hypothetical protein
MGGERGEGWTVSETKAKSEDLPLQGLSAGRVRVGAESRGRRVERPGRERSFASPFSPALPLRAIAMLGYSPSVANVRVERRPRRAAPDREFILSDEPI